MQYKNFKMQSIEKILIDDLFHDSNIRESIPEIEGEYIKINHEEENTIVSLLSRFVDFNEEKIHIIGNIFDTFTNILDEIPFAANILVEHHLMSVFDIILQFNIQEFSLHLLEFLTRFFCKYRGDLKPIMSIKILELIKNSVLDQNYFVCKAGLNCFISLLVFDSGFISYFLENLNIEQILSLNLTNHDIFMSAFKAIACFFLNQNIQYQPIVYNRLYNVLLEKFQSGDSEQQTIGLLCCLVCLSKHNPKEFTQYCEKFAPIVCRFLRMNNHTIIVSSLDFIYFSFFYECHSYFNFIELQQNIELLIKYQNNHYDIVALIFKIYRLVADNLELNGMISYNVLDFAYQFLKLDIYDLKSKAIHFLAIYIHMSNQNQVLSLLNRYNDIIIYLNDFLFAKENIVDRVLNAMYIIVEMMNKGLISEFSKQDFFGLINIQVLHELEEAYDSNTSQYVSINSCIRFLLSEYQQYLNSDLK
ncbi:hypothetical protein TRFO_26462 [Tritrichomonas foetus]|uniref:Uncharacterized protein n=1 Tax=Tritrichomonas foetus TaxID=1144522 RepID=A0A1J4K318_9EUKA|nr:hypothetical protein TRFO_26462 [Tritrichomonas foetus]|eukprot:OHT05775.1 hypothetical protein TRFO_26462 [Tritrichomonas foetus]